MLVVDCGGVGLDKGGDELNHPIKSVHRLKGTSALVRQLRGLPPVHPRLGIDETRFRSVRWWLDGITWKRSDPWLTSFVDCTPMGRDRCWGWLLAAPAAA